MYLSVRQQYRWSQFVYKYTLFSFCVSHFATTVLFGSTKYRNGPKWNEMERMDFFKVLFFYDSCKYVIQKIFDKKFQRPACLRNRTV